MQALPWLLRQEDHHSLGLPDPANVKVMLLLFLPLLLLLPPPFHLPLLLEKDDQSVGPCVDAMLLMLMSCCIHPD